MKIALIGASGMIGSRILDEALSRKHTVTAIVRKPEQIAPRTDVLALAGDATDSASIAATAAGADILISAYSPGDGLQDEFSKNARAILDGLASAKVGRAIIVGGAGSLEVSPGVRLVDSPGFPAELKARALAQSAALDVLRASVSSGVSWTFVSPAASIMPGERTGHFRVGGDQFMVDNNGKSTISAEDFAVAILDEAEKPTAANRRVSVAY